MIRSVLRRFSVVFEGFSTWTKVHRKIVVPVSVLLILALVIPPILFKDPEVAQAALTNLRQEINIINGSLSAASGSYATSSAIVQLDTTKYNGATYYFEVVGSTTAATNATVSLLNAATGAEVASTTINGTVYDRYRSTSFVPTGSADYKVRLNNESVGKGIIAARIIILQNNNPIEKTQTQIEIGNNETYTANATSSLSAPKYWHYNSSKWDGSPIFYAEVTYENTVEPTYDSYFASSTTFTSPGSITYTAATGATSTLVELWGGGGAGGGDGGVNRQVGGGGAGGQYAASTTDVVPGTNYTLVVAATQAGVNGNGSAGNDSTFATTTVVAKGGAGGQTNQTAGVGSSSGCVGTTCNAGGSGGTGTNNSFSGGGGGGAGTGGTGGNASGITAGTGTSEGGGSGGGGKNGNGNDGEPGTQAGGGGSGAYGKNGGGTSKVGGTGAAGQARLTEYGSLTATVTATTTIVLQESDGTGDGFTGWSDKVTIVNVGTATSSTRVRSASFTPTNGRNYRIAVSNGYGGATFAVYNAKIIIDQNPGSVAEEDSYSDSNQSSTIAIGQLAVQVPSVGEAFTSVGGELRTTSFHLAKVGSPACNLFAELYAISGTYGSTAVPTGSALATSETVAASSLTGTLTMTEFTFAGANQYQMSDGTYYFVSISCDTTSDSNYVSVGADNTSPTHSGNSATFIGSWLATNATDVVFTVTSLQGGGDNPTKLEPQFLLANTSLFSGTSLQKFHTYWDSTEWTNSETTFTHQVDAANGSASVVEVDTEGGTQVSGSVVTSPDNVGTSSAMTMPATGDLDIKATTNNGDIYASRILVGVTPDTTPPNPDPPFFSTAPTPDSTSQITSTSTILTDSNAVEYFFTATTSSCGADIGTGGTNSGWQASEAYADSGLQTNKCYGYLITGKDAAGNTTATSTASTTYTHAAVPGGPTYSAVGVTTLTLSNTENGNPAANPTTDFVVLASSTDSNWDGFYLTGTSPATSTSPTWLTDTQIDGTTLTGLQDNVLYDFEVVARNADGILTATSTRTGTTTTQDTFAPTPDPITFSSAPNDVSNSQIDMTSNTASDDTGPVEYQFAYTNNCAFDNGTGGTNSSWQQSTSYSDTTLQTNKCYSYTVQARDAYTNTGAASTEAYAYTAANTPSAPTLDTITTTTFDITINPNSNPASTTYAVRLSGASPADATWEGKYVDGSGNPSASAVWMKEATINTITIAGLNELTSYDVDVKARNGDNDETSFSAVTSTTTADGTAPTPNPPTLGSAQGVDADEVTMTSNLLSDPSGGIEYYFTYTNNCAQHNGTGGNDSGWQASRTYNDIGLQTNMCYSYTVKGRDAANNETAVSNEVSIYSEAENAGAPTGAAITDTTFQIVVADNGNPAHTEYRVLFFTPTPADATWDGKYLNTDGTPTDSIVWMTKATIEAITVTDLNFSTSYDIGTFPRNGNGKLAGGNIGAITTTADATPPTPNTTFSSAPVNDSSTQISMTSVAITDVSTPVNYYFTAVAGSCGANLGTGGTDSGWQAGTSYSDTGLQPNQCYAYTVTGKDNANNTTATSTASSTYTSAATPGLVTSGGVTDTTITINLDENGNPTSNPTTQFAVIINNASPADATWNGMYVDGSGNPSASAVWLTNAQIDGLTVQGLNFATTYTFAAKARNSDNDETGFGSNNNISTVSEIIPRTRINGGVRLQGVRLY